MWAKQTAGQQFASLTCVVADGFNVLANYIYSSELCVIKPDQALQMRECLDFEENLKPDLLLAFQCFYLIVILVIAGMLK